MWRKHALNCATEGARQKVCARRSRRSAFGAPPQAPCEQLRSPKCWRRCDALRPTLARKPPVWRPARLGRRKGVIEESPGSHRVNAAGDQRARHWADWGAAPVLRWRRWRLARRDARMKTRGDSWTESTRRSSLCAFCRVRLLTPLECKSRPRERKALIVRARHQSPGSGRSREVRDTRAARPSLQGMSRTLQRV